ncbi:MAG: hypothetical protein HY286_04660 [Planctomycetes bacterium]|nr:hypothetical protein [Planctomycetota bacterium]
MQKLMLVFGCVLGVVGGAAPSNIKLGPLPFDWTLTIVGALLLLGAYFIRKNTRAGDGESAAAGSLAAAHAAILRAADDVRNLQKDARTDGIESLASRLDAMIKNNIQPVIDAQNLIIEKQGFALYARHTSPWATGERLVYRAWSAATDGHRPEAIASLEESILHFEEAAREWPKY